MQEPINLSINNLLFMRHVTVSPLALEGLGHIRQDVPLGGVHLAGLHVVDQQHVATMALDLSVEGMVVDMPHLKLVI